MFDNDLPLEMDTTDLRNELEQYLNKEVDSKGKDVDVLSWWKAHQREFPHLYWMAMNFYTVSGKSILLLLMNLFITTRQQLHQSMLSTCLVRVALSSRTSTTAFQLIQHGAWCVLVHGVGWDMSRTRISRLSYLQSWNLKIQDRVASINSKFC